MEVSTPPSPVMATAPLQPDVVSSGAGVVISMEDEIKMTLALSKYVSYYYCICVGPTQDNTMTKRCLNNPSYELNMGIWRHCMKVSHMSIKKLLTYHILMVAFHIMICQYGSTSDYHQFSLY